MVSVSKQEEKTIWTKAIEDQLVCPNNVSEKEFQGTADPRAIRMGSITFSNENYI